ncbi:beta-galactosidase [Kordiimonas sp. SCSIO 12610]|uniref:beta-galactosidase n=1 Tax=Kordiimonas sp. SCSIO 12610 TaxID=2829597 RepID=UPI00210C4BEA|nr:beta-galactosidase [Kordiimonas sp. SCSIO 12610]UTW54798.1 beta-galactosidase [Kordiimonas sp. SCSIO 12610]
MLGVCYYPEHWPETMWADDAREMKALGLTYVRIGEFAWSRIEPKPGIIRFEWLDRAIDTLADAGLKVVLGTPTATPPKWLIDKYPEILPIDPNTLQTRGFGSRRHYDFSSDIYTHEAARITEMMAERYGRHEAVAGWQTDNELSCHDTTLSASPNALAGFRAWCKERYQDITALNTAWGAVFWSMEYNDFDEIDLPVGAVTETNPSHQLAFRRYSSDKVVEFHQRMIDVIKKHSPNKWITHNFIPKEDISADTYALGENLDFASYDNYPLGRSDLFLSDAPAETLKKYIRTGHPDLACYYHDTTRSFAKGDFWVMEQQPGPVNWAPNNPRPHKGMIRLWSLEAFAQGAECVSYFRWRQAPFAQEQMHAGLKRVDNSKSSAWTEIEQVYQEINMLDILAEKKKKSKIAIITDVQSLWVTDIQRQANGYDFTRVEFEYYSALRQLGLDVDFISKDTSFDGYSLIVAPSLPIISDDLIGRIDASEALFVFGPLSGSKTEELTMPLNLAPGKLQSLISLKVLSVETLRPDCPQSILYKDKNYECGIWCEELSHTGGETIATYASNEAAIIRQDQLVYIGALIDDTLLKALFSDLCAEQNLTIYSSEEDVRISTRGALTFAFNYSGKAKSAPVPENATILIGGKEIAPYNVTVWRQ